MFAPPPFHPDRPTLVAPVRVDPTGRAGPTRVQSRGKHWRRTSYGFFVPSAVTHDDVDQRIVEALPLLRKGYAVTGWAALRWRGGRWFTGVADDGVTRLPVPLMTTRYVEAQPGFAISQEHQRPGEVEVVDGLPVTTAARSVCFELRHARSLLSAVVALDMAAYSDLVSLDEAAEHTKTLWTWTGVPRCREALALGDENAWSPQEVVMRLVWTLEGRRRRPLCNVPVFDRAGQHVGTPDLIDPVAGVIGEYDGSGHLTAHQRTTDVRREGAFRALGLEHVTMLASDRRDGYRSFLTRLDSAYARALHAPPNMRPWTVTPPPSWIVTTSVESRRGLDPRQRERLLRHRRGA